MKKIKTVVYYLLFFVILGFGGTYGQTFPLWFLEQGKINCKNISVGFSLHSYFKDTTAIENATLQAYIQAAKRKGVEMVINQSVWTTVRGPMLWRKDVITTYDTLLLQSVSSSLTVLDTSIKGDLVLVLVGSNCGNLKNYKKRINITTYPKPKWISNIPSSDEYIYSVGYAPQYLYSSSSWDEAQNAALLELAKDRHLYIASLQKKTNNEYESQSSENIKVKLSNFEVTARWFDKRNKLYFVLMRMRK